MCVQCVAQGAPYVAGTVAALSLMRTRAARSRPGRAGHRPDDTSAETGTTDGTADDSTADDSAGSEPVPAGGT